MARRYTGGFLSATEQVTDADSANGVFTLAEAQEQTALGNFPTGDWSPQRSLRFKATASTKLSRTITTTGSQTRCTVSVWFKRAKITNQTGARQELFSHKNANYGNNSLTVTLTTGDQMQLLVADTSNNNYSIVTTQLFRDTGAWYHLVYAVDSTAVAASDRLRVWINGQPVTNFSSTSYPSQNTTLRLSDSSSTLGVHSWGVDPRDNTYFEGYMSEAYFVDGYALDASYFGKTHASTGTWVPKLYTGAFGTNGHYLPFSNTGSADALGLDMSPSKNIALYSEQFDNAAWSKTNTTVTANAVNDPLNATLTVDKIIPSTTSGSHIIQQSMSSVVQPSTYYTFSVYAKAAGYSQFQIAEANTTGANAYFDLTNGVVVGPAGSNDQSLYDTSASIQSLGSGWYRCTLTLKTGSAQTSISPTFWLANGANAYTYAGDGTSGFYFWGAQLNVGKFANTYVTTTSAAIQNNFTATNLAVSGGDYWDWDMMYDVPGICAVTPGRQNRGNYPIINMNSFGSYLTATQAGLYIYNNQSSSYRCAWFTSVIPPSGKYYWEVTLQGAGDVMGFGIAPTSKASESDALSANWCNIQGKTPSFYTNWQGFAAGYVADGASEYWTVASGDVINFAYNAETGDLWIGKNGAYRTANGTALVVTTPGTGKASRTVDAIWRQEGMVPFFMAYNGTGTGARGAVFNFGQKGFRYTPPEGFMTLCSTSMPDPIIKRPADHFDVKTYAGTGNPNANSLTVGATAKQSSTARPSGSGKFRAANASYMSKAPMMATASGGSLATAYNFTISADTSNYSLYNTARAAGYDGKSLATFNLTISAGVVVGSVSTQFPALDLSGFPKGVAINVTVGSGAYVVGAGGNGGYGNGWPGTGGSGSPGGDAIWASSPVTITNNGTVAGGGGGGGGSEGWAPNGAYGIGGGGGGGGAGRIVGTGAPGSTTSAGGTNAGAGGTGTLTTGGSGGSGGYHSGYTAGAGGAGGNLGAAGANGAGSPGNWNGSNYNPGPGGSAGYYIRGSSSVTWATAGTQAGSASTAPQKYTGSGTTWTWSAWVKRTTTGATQRLFTCANASGDDTAVRFETDAIRFYNSTQLAGGNVFDIKSSASYADTNWHHIVAVCDTTNTVQQERVRLYVDGARISSLATATTPSQYQISTMNWNIPQYLGIYPVTLTDEKFDGYMSEVNFVDGLALDPSYFGDFDANNKWKAKTYTGTYGAAGYYLPFTGQTMGSQSYATSFEGTSNSQYLSIADNAALDMGSSDFTAECFYYPSYAGSPGTAYSIFGKRTAGSYGGMLLHASIATSFLPRFVATLNGSTWGVDISSSVAFVPYVWNHIAVTRSGNLWTMWVNGQNAASTTVAGTIPDNAAPFVIGNSSVSDSALMTGKISNFRLIKGSAIYSAPFTPPTTALTAVSNTVLLTCQDSTFRDNSTNNFTVTSNLVANPQIAYPFAQIPTYSAYFNGSSSYLTLPSGTGDLGTGDFTIEYWALNLSSGQPTNYSPQVGTLADGTPANSWRFGTFGSTGKVCFAYHNGTTYTDVYFDNVNYNDDKWHHFALTRSGTTFRAYVDGFLIGTATISQNLTNGKPLVIGREGYTPSYYKGNISNLRLVVGTALYTDPTIVVPRTPLTAVSGTKVLTCLDAGIRDLSSNNYVVTNNNTVSPNQTNIPPASSGIGAEASGLGNYWGVSNFKLGNGGAEQDWDYSAPADYVDSNGTIRADYAILNQHDKGSNVTVSNGGLTAAITATGTGVAATLGVTKGKWYWEVTPSTQTGADSFYVSIIEADKFGFPGATQTTMYNSTYLWTYYGVTGQKGTNGNIGWASYGSTFGVNDVIGVALDMDLGTVTFYKNNVSQGVAFTGLNGKFIKPAVCNGASTTGVTMNVNFGQLPFKYTPPAGHNSINTKNLADVGSINTPDTYGNFVNTPDLVWIKARSNSYNHSLFDTTRGINRPLCTHSTSGQDTTPTDNLLAFLPNGFTVGGNNTGSLASTNVSGHTYVSWNWNRGSIPGFDIVQYQGTGAAQEIKHSLGKPPKFMVFKSTTTTGHWTAYHENMNGGTGDPTYGYIRLNGTDGFNLESAGSARTRWWNDKKPANNSFTIGAGSADQLNVAGNSYIGYLWAEVPGFSKISYYVGNGSSDGTFVYCGFKPKWIMVKNVGTTTYDWLVLDSTRDTYNSGGTNLRPNQNYQEGAEAANKVDFLSNGFKLRGDSTGSVNSAHTYIYIAFAENPFKYANAR